MVRVGPVFLLSLYFVSSFFLFSGKKLNLFVFVTEEPRLFRQIVLLDWILWGLIESGGEIKSVIKKKLQ